tara:strand:+ start:380 stop:1714 length:1335 start_codon:yes stop_codon:yes gene_type:complete
MSNTFQNPNTQKDIFGQDYSVPMYLQFVAGYCAEVCHSDENPHFDAGNHINTIIAVPAHNEKYVTKESALGNEDYRYFPLFRGITDVPTKGDPVLLTIIGGVNYYLGPLNTDNNSVTWNSPGDAIFKRDMPLPVADTGEVTSRGALGESPNFYKNLEWERLTKDRREDLDYGNAINETTGDLLMEGRHGNSIRIGSRSKYPYIFMSNFRNNVNPYETFQDGSIISITSNGTLQQHFENIVEPISGRTILGFRLASDLAESFVIRELPFNRSMQDLIETVNNEYPNEGKSIYEYGKMEKGDLNTKANQVFLHSDRITLNTRLDDIYLSSIKDIHIGTGRHLTISNNENLIIESQKTFLGNPFKEGKDRSFTNVDDKQANSKMQPAVLGQRLHAVLNDMLTMIQNINSVSSQLGQVKLIVDPKEISNLTTSINNILSNKHFIEPNT